MKEKTITGDWYGLPDARAYLGEPSVERLICECGCKELEVFQGGYATVTRCPKCQRAFVIHEG